MYSKSIGEREEARSAGWSSDVCRRYFWWFAFLFAAAELDAEGNMSGLWCSPGGRVHGALIQLQGISNDFGTRAIFAEIYGRGKSRGGGQVF